MRGHEEWARQDSQFWAYVKVLSESRGYTRRGDATIAAFTIDESKETLAALGRDPRVLDYEGLAERLADYFEFRAFQLNEVARNNLMDVQEARELFDEVASLYCGPPREIRDRGNKVVAIELDVIDGTTIRVPMNKQSGPMRAPAYLTGLVNILFSHALGGRRFEFDPRRLPVIDSNGELFAAMSRRLDGAYPSSVNPRALWEIKEYYYTTTFGSKVSDGVYVSQLDGYERAEIMRAGGSVVDLYLFIDARYTWWDKGKSYLCRLVDAVNRGVVDEVVIGRECLDSIPRLVREWDLVP